VDRIPSLDTTDPADPAAADFEVALVSLNQWQLAWRRFRRHKLAMFGAGLFLTFVAIAIVGPFILPYDATAVPYPLHYCPGSTTLLANLGCPPLSGGHILGTIGGTQEDLLVLVVNGSRLSLTIGIGAAAFASVLGAIVGGVSGYFGGWTDTILMRIVDVLLSMPLLFVIIVFAKVFGYGDWRVILIVFAALGWPSIARLVRSLFLTLRTEVFVDAARAVGVSDMRIIFRHILPNAMSPIIVVTTLSVAGFIVTEAFVSYLGFGVNAAYQPTWGNILSNAQNDIIVGNWWWPLFPGLAIVLTVLGINFMGDGLRDALDPRSRE
jgi:ABC-type dipeptide/oligopeptide/nickel transport system permease subunit